MLEVMTVVGTRPELIRLSRVIARTSTTLCIMCWFTLARTYDYLLNNVFFAALGIREPDHLLGVDTSSLGRVLGETLIRTEQVLLEERPDAVVLGDTNSSIAAVMAKRMRVPVYHMEAGNRCFDENVPEEQPTLGGPCGRFQPRLHRARPP